MQTPSRQHHNEQAHQADRYASLVPEILWTEGRYVQGLERFSALQHLVLDQAVLPADAVSEIFGNVDALLALHKQLLAQMRATSALPRQDQDWSTAFSTFAKAPDIYVAYIANHKAQINAAVRQHDRILSTSGPPEVLQLVSDRYMIHHTFQWPYSRFARYSRILKELLHEIQPDEAKHASLQAATAAYHDILNRANEALTQKSLDLDAGHLLERVEDWKGLDPSTFGKLVLFQTLRCRPGARPESEAPFQVYLFESILICCKKRRHGAENPEAAPLRLKGRIFLVNIVDMGVSPGPAHRLNLLWRAAHRVEPTTLIFSSPGVMSLWVDKIQRLRTCNMERRNQDG
ncbi:Rho guanyl nucleotide exchange factor [Metarhizium guizhouense ARSEF 977]|uniref:Rho guanyl nucleotide exchange factor n=1 Tax=Metarhizium guizhouense (strain ARSEF 977) TaxID=1276136 RepID=A0A0B4GP19_METGA|nr:Rho guanyl nucleotide exchange factor [Metarhizium guizhouense ARSEF 977]